MSLFDGAQSTYAGGQRSSSVVDGSLALGFLVLGGAVMLAYWTPAETYELSIYAATPTLFWIGIGVALFTSLVVAIGLDGYGRAPALGLGGSAFAIVAALPLIRGYHFYGDADSLTHLGYLRDIHTGTTTLEQFFYPGLHSLALVLSEGTGFSQERSLLFVVFVTAVVFVLFVPLVVRALVEDDFAVSLGVFAAMMLLPINHISTHYIEPHSMSQTILLFPLALYLLVIYVQSDADLLSVTPIGVLVALVSIATVLYHPLQAAMLVLLYVTAVVLQVVCRRYGEGHTIANHRPVYGQAAFLIAVYGVWTLGKRTFWNTADVVAREAHEFLFTGEAQAGEVVGVQSTSLAAIGVSLGEVFLKLFLVSALFAVLAGVLVLRSVLDRFDGREAGSEYFAAALFLFAPASLVLFVGDVSKLSFRLQGSIMVIVTILGTVALYRFISNRSTGEVTRVIRVAVLIVIALMLVHSLLIMYTSPYMYHGNRQVSDAQLSGYENSFEMGEPGVNYAGVRGGPGRYMQAVYGVEGVPDSMDLGHHKHRSDITDQNLVQIGNHYDDDQYVVVSKRDYERELGAYRSLRYSRSQLDSVRTQRDVHRVRSNGPFRLYLYDTNRTTTTD